MFCNGQLKIGPLRLEASIQWHFHQYNSYLLEKVFREFLGSDLGSWCWNISAISYRPVLLSEETGVPGENHRPAESLWQTLSHKIVSSTPDFLGNSGDLPIVTDKTFIIESCNDATSAPSYLRLSTLLTTYLNNIIRMKNKNSLNVATCMYSNLRKK